MGWVQDKDGFVVAPDSKGFSDFANIIGADGEIIHVQNVGRIAAHCAEMQKEPGWSKTREFKRCASVPLVVFMKHPALAQLETNEQIDAYMAKYLPEYRTSHETRGVVTPNIIIK